MIIEVFYFKWSGHALSQAVTVVMLLYYGFAYADLIDYQSRIKAFLKGVGVCIAAQVILMILFFIVLMVMILTLPEFREMVRPSNNR